MRGIDRDDLLDEGPVLIDGVRLTRRDQQWRRASTCAPGHCQGCRELQHDWSDLNA